MTQEITDQIFQMVERDRGVRKEKLSLDSRLLHDLKMDGDDAYEFFLDFSKRFGIDPATIDLSPYFGPEPHLFNLNLEFLINFKKYQTKYEPLTIQDLIDMALARAWLK